MDQIKGDRKPHKPLSFADAAVKILETSGVPLHYRIITQKALDQALIQTTGKTPENTLSSVLSVDIKQNSHQSRFVRVRPGVFGLSSWELDVPAAVLAETSREDEGRRVRVPLFPSYTELRLVLPVWNGWHKSQITGLKATIDTLTGTPRNPGDWTNPDEWIVNKLKGNDRELAEAIWKQTKGKVNPRHVYGHWLLARTYQLLEEDSDGRMLLTERGQNFVDCKDSEAVVLVDEQEGILTILTIVAEKGTGRLANFLDDWTDYLA